MTTETLIKEAPKSKVAPAPAPRVWPEHDRKVAAIAAAVRERAAKGETAGINKGGVHHVVPLPGDKRFATAKIDVSALKEILEIDVERRLCTAEPGVTFARIVEATLKHGLLPTVVPELEGITIGGAVAGCSVESMSYRYGGFHDSAVEYELVTGKGEVVTCSPTREADTFHMIHGSYGTLSILSRLTFKLIPAKPFVHMTYRRYPSAESFHAALLERCEAGDVDFIDGIVHSPTEQVLCLGRFVDEAPYLSNYRWLNIFYKSTRKRDEDYLKTPDYLFRYDTECHWLTKTVPPLEWKAVRFAVGKLFLGSTNLIKWSGRLEAILKLKKRPDVVVDVFVPARRCPEFYAWYEREYAFYPLWVVPYAIPETYPWVSAEHGARMNDKLFMDLAVYGKKNNHPTIDYSQVLEEKTFEHDGIKTLISRNHYSKERFWQIYNEPNYRAQKQKLDPNGVFKDMFEKLHRVE